MKVTLTLPYPISTNRYWRFTKYKGVHVSHEAKEYKSQVRNICWLAGMKPTDGAVDLKLKLVPRGERHMDLDNCLKITLDALQGLAYWNDRQVRKIFAEIAPAEKDHPRLEVEIG